MQDPKDQRPEDSMHPQGHIEGKEGRKQVGHEIPTPLVELYNRKVLFFSTSQTASLLNEHILPA